MGVNNSRESKVYLKSNIQPDVVKAAPPFYYRPFPEHRNKGEGELIAAFGAIPVINDTGLDEYWIIDGQFLPCNDSLYVLTSAIYRPRATSSWVKVQNINSRKIYKIDFKDVDIKYVQVSARPGSTYPIMHISRDSLSALHLAADSVHVTSMIRHAAITNQQRARDVTFGKYRDFSLSPNGEYFAIFSKSGQYYFLHIYFEKMVTRPVSTLNVTKLYEDSVVDVGHQHDLASVKWSPDGNLVGVGMSSNHLVIFDWRKGVGVCSVFQEIVEDCYLSSVKAYEFDSTSCRRFVFAGSSCGCIYKFDCEGKAIYDKVKLERGATVDIMKHRYDDSRLVVALQNFVIQLYSGEDLSLLCEIKMKDYVENLSNPPMTPRYPSVVTMDVTSNGQQVVTGTWNGLLTVWQLPKVLNLKFLCKYTILSCVDQGNIKNLPLPSLIKDYLLSFPYMQ